MEPLDKKAKSVKACETCKKPFGLTKLRHTCKRCNKVICADCYKGRIKIVTYDLKAAHKVCYACEKEHNFQVNFKTSNQTSWNTLSKIGQKWLAACNPKQKLTQQSQEGFEESYKGYLDIVKSPYFSTSNNYFAMIDRDISQGRLDRERTNYSFQEFLYYNQAKVTQEQVRASMANVLKAFIVKFPEIGYCQGMNYVCMFLLCLMDEESAFWTLGYVVANLVPVNFYGQTDFGVPLFGFQQEKFVLSNLIKEHLQLDSDMAQKITTLLDVHGASLLAPLLANFSNFEVLYETWNMMLTNNSINEIRKVIIAMMKLFLPKLKQRSMINPVEFQIMVIRLFNSEEFKDAQSIQIDDEHVRFLEAKFKGDHSNWQSHETKIHYTMRRALKFNKDQIRSMKERFDKLLGTRPRRSTSKMNLSMAEDPEGVAREDFRKLLTDVLSNDPESKGFMESLDVDALYDSLDSDNCGVLDFKEFLFLISMMLKGSFEEKLQSAFYVFDSGDKGVLTSNEFDQFLQVLVQTTVQANQDNITPFFNQDLENFNEKMASITNDKEKINFDMIRKELFNSNFIKYSEVIEKLGQQNDGTSKRNTMTKDPNFDTSVLHTNQTYMDSTQDTTHLTHQTHHKADDLTRILDHSQSTILEESKYEEDKPNDDILTEAQKEKILVEEKAPEPVKKEEEKKAGVIEEVEADGTRKSSKVEYTHTASAKSLIEKFNKNKQVASAMPPKKEPTTKLVGKLADSDKKFGGQASFEKLFENSLVSSDSLTSFDDSDHRKQPELSFNFDEDKRAHLHPLANMSKPASIPFGRNFLSPLELSDVDIKPTDMSDFTLSFLNNTSEFSPEHISVNVSLQIAKPFAENAYEPLALDSPAQKPVLDEWKLGFFESTNQPLLPISHLSQSSNTHNKPFHDNTMFALAPEHDFSLPPGLQMWKIDQIEHGDKPVKPVELVRPLQPLKKPISSQGGSETLLSSNILEAPILDTLKGNGFEQVDQGVKPGHVSSLLKVIKKPFAEVGQYNPLPSQNLVDRPTLDISEGKLFGFFNTSDSIKPAAAQNISAAIKKPFHQSHLTPLPQSYPENASKFLEWKEGCFEVTEQRVHEMNPQKSMNHIQNPFSGGAYMAMESEERVFEAPFATNWKQDCFESFEKQPKQAEIVRILAPAKKPFAEGGYQPLARHERFFDAPVLEGWKEDCFGPIERPVQQIKPASPLQAVNKPFNDGFYHALVPEHQVLEKSTLTGWKEDCFSSTRQPAVPVQHLVHVLKPVRKPFSGGESASLPVQEASIGLSLLHGYKEDCFTAHNQPAAPAQLAYTSKVIRKPFSGGESHTLHKETALPDIATLEWKEDCFTSTESPIRPSEKPSLIPIARKPISGGAAQTLPKDNTFSDMITLEWKEDCFLSSESPLEPNEGVSLIKSIGRPFADGACQPLPPHEHSLDDSLLGGWKPDWLQGDTQLVSHTDSTQPLKTKKKPIEEGTVYSNLKQEEGLLDASDLQSWTEELFHSTEKSIAPMDVDQPLSTNRKPFAEGTCQPLSKDDHLFDSISFEEELFSALEAQCQPMELAHHLKRVQKPFEETGYSAIQPQERGNDHPTLIGWTETCFEANDMASAKIGIVQTIKHTKNPFTGGTCEAVPVDRRHFDDYELVGGWKEDCFSKEDVQVLPSEPSQTLRPVKKPFADAGCQALETGQGSMVSAPVSWKSDMFLQTDKQHSATAPVNKLQPVTKPIKNAGALVPLVQALPEIEVENTLFSHSDMNIFGAQDKASRPQSRPSEVPRAIQVNKPMFANMARHLEADKGDSEIIFIVDNIDVVDSKVSPVKAQDLARISKNAAKVERYLYGNHAEDQKPEESEIRDSLEARYPYFSQTDKALRPHQWPGYKELIPKVPKEIKFEHIEERKNDESGTTTVIVNSASGSNKSDDFEIVREHGEQLLIEREHSQEEHVVKASEKIVYEDDEEETAGDSMFINKSAIENDTIYTNIGESSAGKRKRNAFDLEADPKTNSSCKVCSLF